MNTIKMASHTLFSADQLGTTGEVVAIALVVTLVVTIVQFVRKIARRAKRAAIGYGTGAAVAGGGVTNVQQAPERFLDWLVNN